MRYRRCVVAFAAIAALSGCSAHDQPWPSMAGTVTEYAPVSAQAATAYLQSHPVTARPGMTAGIVLHVDVTDFPPEAPIGTAVTLTMMTADGKEATVTCGNLARSDPCTVRDAGKLANTPGSYWYFRSNGILARPDDLQLITAQAVS